MSPRSRSWFHHANHNIANADALGTSLDYVVPGAAPTVAAVFCNSVHGIRGNYDNTVLVKVKTPYRIADYRALISAFNLQPSTNVISHEKGLMTNFVLDLSSYG